MMNSGNQVNYVEIADKRYTIGQLVGSGQQGAVYQIMELIDDRSWVVKIGLDTIADVDDSLRSEYRLLEQFANEKPQAPPVPRVKAGVLPASGRFALAMENVPEEAQLQPWIQQRLSGGDVIAGEIAIWEIAQDYLDLMHWVHTTLKRSVTDRKLSDLRIVTELGQPRLIVLDWSLVAEHLDPVNDMRIFGQLWYTMITMQAASDTGQNAYHPLKSSWHSSLLIGGRMILQQCLNLQYPSLSELLKDLADWVYILRAPDKSQLRAETSAVPHDATPEQLMKALRAADLLMRLDRESYHTVYDDLVTRYLTKIEQPLEQIRAQATRRVRDAVESVNILRDQWQRHWPELLPILDTWDDTLDKLNQIEDERQVLGSHATSIRTIIANVRERISSIYATFDIKADQSTQVQQVLNELKGAIERVSGISQSSQTLMILRNLHTEATILQRLIESENHLLTYNYQDAHTAVVEAKSLFESLPEDRQLKLHPILGVRLDNRLDSLDRAELSDGMAGDTEPVRQAVRKGDFAEAIRLYQRMSLSPASTPYQRLLWQEVIEAVYLVQHMDQLTVNGWLEVLQQIVAYLNRPNAFPQIARHVLQQMDVAYELFVSEKSLKRPSNDVYALVLGEMLLSVHQRCELLLKES